jgi:U3 small nucleolar RNA-associated protein 20
VRGERQGAVSSFVYKLSRFALDVLRSILNKFQSLLTPTNLTGFLPIIGDALVNAHDEVKISAIRLLSSVVKLPLPEIDKNSNIYLTEAVKIVKEATNTNSEAVQASLKLIASILRERKSTTLRDGHLAYLLKRLSADIDEPDCQGVTFNFIKAVMERKFLVPEMYELIENIASMMITNQTRNSRDLARGTYIYFLIEYPQARGRWAKQLGFLVKNLDYQYREGRQSVMEAVHMLLAKTGGELAQEIIGTFFLPLVMVMANDEAEDCREMAGALLGELFSRADREQIQIILKSLLSWLDQVENMQLVSTGLQAVRIFYEADRPESEKEGRYLIELLPRLMNLILADRESEQWQVLYFSLQIFMRLCKKSPSIALSEDYGALWSIVRQSLAYPHLWIKTCAANLIGIRLADLAKSSASSGYGSVPLVGQYGLRLGEEAMLQLAGASLRCLQVPGVSEDLAMQSVRNIIFLCRCFAENGLGFTETADDEIGDQGLSNSGSDVEEEGGPSRGSLRLLSLRIHGPPQKGDPQF